jgi:hypothetical protein
MSDQFNILDYTEGPLLKTGQTTNYTPAGRTSQDDGGVQAGIAGSMLDGQYIILTTGQYSGTTNITIGALTDIHSNECVFDKVTGLMWSRTPSAAVFGVGTQNLFWSSEVLLEDIFNYCDQANLAGLSGFNNWRIPNIKELFMMRIIETPSALPNTVAFPSIVDTTILWSSTTSAKTVNVALVNAFTSGGTYGVGGNGSDKTSTRLSCLLVRNS